MPFLFCYYCTCRKPGSGSSSLGSSSLCVNWWCYNNAEGGAISTQLNGNGRARLDYGLCLNPFVNNKVTVYLNGIEISSVIGTGSVMEPSKVIEFDYSDSDTLKIQETGNGILQFNSFSVVGCKSGKSFITIIIIIIRKIKILTMKSTSKLTA